MVNYETGVAPFPDYELQFREAVPSWFRKSQGISRTARITTTWEGEWGMGTDGCVGRWAGRQVGRQNNNNMGG